MKKVIEQKKPIGDVRVWIDLKERIELRQSWGNGEHETVIIEKSKAREVALAICPELGEPTIKTDNTQVIAHLESELEKAKELLKKYIDQNRISKTGLLLSLIEMYSLKQ